MALIIPSSALVQKVRALDSDQQVAYILASICELNEVGEAAGGASTPVAAAVNVVETVGGQTLAAANPDGQMVEAANIGENTIYLRYDGAAPTTTAGIPVPPGAVWVSPRRIKTAVKAITAADEESLVFTHRLP